MSQWITQIATSYRGAVAAFAGGGELEGRVFLWNLATGSREADLTTEFDMGGRRLAINQTGSRRAVGSWNGRSLSLHNVLTETLSWRHAEMEKVEGVAFSLDDAHVYCHFGEDRMMEFREADGETARFRPTVADLRGVEEYWESPFDPLCVRVPWPDPLNRITVMTTRHSPVARIRRKTFGFLDYAFAQGPLCVSDSTGPVSCYHLRTGDELWTFDPGKGVHALNVAWVQSAGCFAALTYSYQPDGEHTIYLLDAAIGKPIAAHPLPPACPHAFAHSGEWVVAADGSVTDTLTAKRLRTLPLFE
ncbi:MAG: hypothetical protein ACKV19_27415 [Verrucomicrobiales bacterium]